MGKFIILIILCSLWIGMDVANEKVEKDAENSESGYGNEVTKYEYVLTSEDYERAEVDVKARSVN